MATQYTESQKNEFWTSVSGYLTPCNLIVDYQRSDEYTASIFRIIISQILPVNLALRFHLRACPLPGLVHSSHRVLRGLQQFT